MCGMGGEKPKKSKIRHAKNPCVHAADLALLKSETKKSPGAPRKAETIRADVCPICNPNSACDLACCLSRAMCPSLAERKRFKGHQKGHRRCLKHKDLPLPKKPPSVQSKKCEKEAYLLEQKERMERDTAGCLLATPEASEELRSVASAPSAAGDESSDELAPLFTPPYDDVSRFIDDDADQVIPHNWARSMLDTPAERPPLAESTREEKSGDMFEQKETVSKPKVENYGTCGVPEMASYHLIVSSPSEALVKDESTDSQPSSPIPEWKIEDGSTILERELGWDEELICAAFMSDSGQLDHTYGETHMMCIDDDVVACGHSNLHIHRDDKGINFGTEPFKDEVGHHIPTKSGWENPHDFKSEFHHGFTDGCGTLSR